MSISCYAILICTKLTAAVVSLLRYVDNMSITARGGCKGTLNTAPRGILESLTYYEYDCTLDLCLKRYQKLGKKVDLGLRTK